MDFVVYGYMNRGEHEGEVGTAVYHYDGLVQTIEEEVFIPSDTSYEILKAQMGQLMYVNEQGMLYLILDEKLYQVNLDSLSTKVLVEGLKENCYKISQSNQYFAWVDAEQEFASSTITLMNLNDGSTYEISESGNEYLRPLGFISYMVLPKPKRSVSVRPVTRSSRCRRLRLWQHQKIVMRLSKNTSHPKAEWRASVSQIIL